MNVYDRILKLANMNGYSIAEIERKLDFSANSIGKWKRTSPSSAKVAEVAKFFGVSTDYLLGLTNDTKKKDSDEVYFRMDSTGLNDDEKNELQKEIDFLQNYLTSKIIEKRKNN